MLSYQSISESNCKAKSFVYDDESVTAQIPSLKRHLVGGILAVGLLFVGVFVNYDKTGDANESTKLQGNVVRVAEARKTGNFPEKLNHLGIYPDKNRYAVDTKEAAENGWKKVDAPCNEKLGEAWLYNGKRSKAKPVTLYFTPAVKGEAGLLSAIEADYYDHVEKKLVGEFFTQKKNAKDGNYWSVAVLLRKPTKQGLCDKENPAKAQASKYLALAPEMENKIYPTNSNDPKMKANFVEGHCQPTMGFHWFSDISPGKDLTYKTKNLIPISVFYNSVTGEMQGFYFIATEQKLISQFWDPVAFVDTNQFPMHFCNQFCDPNCQFKGSNGGFATMHFFFQERFGPGYDKCEFDNGKTPPIYYPSKIIYKFFCRKTEDYPEYSYKGRMPNIVGGDQGVDICPA